jgi:hypothetical protein
MLKSSLTMVLAVLLVLAANYAYADEYKLQYQTMDLHQQAVPMMGQIVGASTRAAERLSGEPKYRSKTPIYAVAEFATGSDSKYTMVFDESKGTGRGYDVLYFDRNNNEDLRDDPPIAGQIQRRNYVAAVFGPFEAMVNYSDRTASLYFSVEYIIYGEQVIHHTRGPIRNMRVRLQNIGWYTGLVSFGDARRLIALIDYNGNGLFNDCFRRSSGHLGEAERFLYANGDEILIDANGDGRFEGGYMSNRELYPYGKYIQSDGNWYSLKILDHGGSVEVKGPHLELGTVKVRGLPESCLLELLSDEGILKIVGSKEEFQVPAGTYQLYALTLSSGEWQCQARGKVSGSKFHVREGGVVALPFGPPIRVNVQSSRHRLRAGQTVNLGLSISGQAGEVYINVIRNGRRPSAPTFSAIDETGRIVATGTFRYG